MLVVDAKCGASSARSKPARIAFRARAYSTTAASSTARKHSNATASVEGPALSSVAVVVVPSYGPASSAPATGVPTATGATPIEPPVCTIVTA